MDQNYGVKVSNTKLKRTSKKELQNILNNEHKKIVELHSKNEMEEDNFDLFGNEISIPCYGDDNGIYDLSSMEYLFQKDEDDDFIHIPYKYNSENERVPNFPVMNEGKPLTSFYCLALDE